MRSFITVAVLFAAFAAAAPLPQLGGVTDDLSGTEQTVDTTLAGLALRQVDIDTQLINDLVSDVISDESLAGLRRRQLYGDITHDVNGLTGSLDKRQIGTSEIEQLDESLQGLESKLNLRQDLTQGEGSLLGGILGKRQIGMSEIEQLDETLQGLESKLNLRQDLTQGKGGLLGGLLGRTDALSELTQEAQAAVADPAQDLSARQLNGGTGSVDTIVDEATELANASL